MFKKLRTVLTSLIIVVFFTSQLCVFGAEKTLDEIKKSLSFSSLTNQSITEIKENFSLSVAYEGAFVIWESDNENVLCIDGGSGVLTARVIRPPFGEGYVSATLTAYITKDDEMTEKSFFLRIKEQDIGFKYSKSITEAYKLFEMDFLSRQDLLSVKSDLVLPQKDAYGTVALTYKSDNPTVLSDDGKVNRNYDEDSVVTLTVFFTEGFESFKASYPLTVKAYTDDEIRTLVQKDLHDAVTELKTEHNLLALNKSISLPTSGIAGSLIAWETSNSDVIDSNGVINTAAKGSSAVLTATATYHGATASSTLEVKVASTASPVTEIEGNQGLGDITYGGGGGGGGASKDDKEDTKEETSASFYDVPQTHWAFKEIEEMKKRGILDGTGNGNFEPDLPLTREQALKLIVNTLGIVCEGSYHPFADVGDDAWYKPFVVTCFSAGIVKGVYEEWFGIGNNVSRQDFCVMLSNAMKYREMLLPENNENTFLDSSSVSGYAKNAVNTLAAGKIIGGMPDGSFMPFKNMTRAEAATVLWRVLNR